MGVKKTSHNQLMYLPVVMIKDLWFPTTKANAIQSFKMAESISKLTPTELWIPLGKTKDLNSQAAKSAFDLTGTINIHQIPSYYHPTTLPVISAFENYAFKISFYRNIYKLLQKIDHPTIIYSREPESIVIAHRINLHKKRHNLILVYGLHRIPENWYDKLLVNQALNAADRNIVISHYLQRELKKRGFGSKVLPDGVDTDWLNQTRQVDTIKIRKKYHIPLDKQIIMYAGSNTPWKGVDCLVETARADKRSNRHYVVVGFTGESHANLQYIDHVTRQELRQIYLSADCFVMPYSAKFPISKHYMSPLKLFEYMAMKKPLICSKLPSIQEIVSEKCVWFCEPDNASDLLRAIETIFDSSVELRNQKIESAYQLTSQYTWEMRAERLLTIASRTNS